MAYIPNAIFRAPDASSFYLISHYTIRYASASVFQTVFNKRRAYLTLNANNLIHKFAVCFKLYVSYFLPFKQFIPGNELLDLVVD